MSFLGPELGLLAGLLIGPEAGSWLLEEAHISSSRTRHMDRCAADLAACTHAALKLPEPEKARSSHLSCKMLVDRCELKAGPPSAQMFLPATCCPASRRTPAQPDCIELLFCARRFVCREVVGGAKQPAAYLTVVPEGAVVYGSGPSSVILTKVGTAGLGLR